ncbi:MAG: ABC transporter permease [Anaerolineaceae bacterium]|nr:MAG: ABC transporter permease [Anaerolineaceae bacterium]
MKSNNLKNISAKIADKLGAWLLIILIAAIMLFTSDKFLTTTNMINVFRQIAVVSIGAIGVSFVILGGGFDLSTGMIATFAGCNTALFMKNFGWNMYFAMIVAILIGIAIGTVNGLLITYLKIPPFICTLGMQYVINGLVFVTTKSVPITGLPEKFLKIGRGYIFGFFPVPVLIMFLFVIVGHIVLKYTVFGRSVVAIGENETAAKLSGLNLNLIKVAMYSLSGFCVSAAGIVLAARLSSGQPNSGADLSLQAIAAVYIGGTFKGSIVNTLAGALVWGFMNNALNLMNVNAYWQKVALGVVIIGAVLFDTFRAKLASKSID